MQQRHPAAAVRMTGLPHRLRPDRGMFQCRYSIFTGLPNRLRPDRGMFQCRYSIFKGLNHLYGYAVLLPLHLPVACCTS